MKSQQTTTVRIKKDTAEILNAIVSQTNLPRWVIISQALRLYGSTVLPKHRTIIEEIDEIQRTG